MSVTWQMNTFTENKNATPINQQQQLICSQSSEIWKRNALLPARWVRGINSGASTFNVVGIGHFSGKYFVRIIVRSGEISTPELSLTAWNQQNTAYNKH